MNVLRGSALSAQADDATPTAGLTRLIEPLADPLADAPARRTFLGVAIVIILLFWIAELTQLTALLLFRSPESALPFLLPRAMVSAAGLAISFGMLAVQSAARNASLLKRSLLAIGLAVIGSTLHALANELVFSNFVDSRYSWGEVMPMAIGTLWTYMSISVILLALTYGETCASGKTGSRRCAQSRRRRRCGRFATSSTRISCSMR